MIVMNVVNVELVKQKLRQLWGLLIKWRITNFVQWAFSRFRYFCKLLDMNLPAVKSTRQFIIKRIAHVANPSSLWSSTLKAREPLPTSAAWLNFVLNEGSMPEYIHPYLISCKQGALCICYCAPTDGPQTIKQDFVPDIMVGSASTDGAPFAKQHMVTSFDDLSVTLQLQGGIQVPLVRGCPYVTFIFKTTTFPTFGSAHKASKLESADTKHKLFLENGQTWIIYSSHKLLLQLVEPGMIKVKEEYKGHLRIVLLNGGADAEAVLDKHAAIYPVGGKADLSVRFQVKYTWGKVGLKQETLLMLTLPIHRDMMAHDDNMDPSRRPSVAYDGIDGKMEAIASDSWILKMEAIGSDSKTRDAVGWHSIGGIQDSKNKKYLEAALRRDMSELMMLPKNVISAYSHGKFMARVARMAMIAEELDSCLDLLKQAREFLSDSLTPWVEGTLGCNAFIYDSKWGGIIVHEKRKWLSQSAKGIYDDAHYTLGYFCYAGAVLSKLDGAWGEAHKSHLYTLVRDYMSAKSGSRRRNEFELSDTYVFPKLRYFDLWVLHSWSGDGLVEHEHGRRQISSSEAVHAYYAGAMLGLAFKDQDLVNLGLTLAFLEIKAAQLLWHIPSSSSVYPHLFKLHNRMVGVLWANKRESIGPVSTAGVHTQTAKDTYRLALSIEGELSGEALILPPHLVGMQVHPLQPISEFLFINTAFAKELVDWASPFMGTSLTDAWKGYVYALESLYEPNSDVSKKAFALSYSHHESSTSQSILLWWIYSKGFIKSISLSAPAKTTN